MNWKFKSALQNLFEFIPTGVKFRIYYLIQRNFNKMDDSTRVVKLKAGVEVYRKLKNLGYTLADKTLLELGSGKTFSLLIVFWLLGAKRLISTDLYPYVNESTLKKDLKHFRENQELVRSFFNDINYYQDRFQKILNFDLDNFKLTDFLNLLNLEYISPADASKIKVENDTVDFCVTNAVLEHIEPKALKEIILEGIRVLKPGALFVNFIDHSDHFARVDKNISRINFLKFSDIQWKKYNSNQFAYVNRLQADDYQRLFEQLNQDVIYVDHEIDKDVLMAIESSKIKLDLRFSHKSKEVLAAACSWIISQKPDSV